MRQGRFLSVSAQYLYWINIDYCRLETGTSFFVLRFEIVQFGQWIFIHDKEKIQALPTHWQARLKMYIINRSFQFKALLTLNAIPIGFFIIIFFFVLPFSIIFLPMISVCSLLMQLKLYTFLILCILSNVKPQFTYSGQNILFKRWAEMYFVMSVFKIERSSFSDQCQHSSK